MEPTSILEMIGHTPLISLARLSQGVAPATIYAKAEWLNPGGSVKDRSALFVIRQGEKSGQLSKGKVILDFTSGNMGNAYAMIGAALGYAVELVMPANASEER